MRACVAKVNHPFVTLLSEIEMQPPGHIPAGRHGDTHAVADHTDDDAPAPERRGVSTL